MCLTREKEVELLRSKLRLRLFAEKKMRDRKNSAMRAARSAEAKRLTLQVQRDAAVLRVRELRESLLSLEEEKEAIVEEADKKGQVKTRTDKNGKPYTDEFEAPAVACLADGISAKMCREQMIRNGNFLNAGDEFVVPEIDWFERLRERIGNESMLYAFAKVARAEEVLQHGSDETGIHRQGTYNQWVRIKNDCGDIETVYIETGGILVGATTAEVAAHIERTWERGQAYVDALRVELGDEADELVPLTKGGVNLLKLRSLMHDTCNTANATAREIAKLVDKKGRDYFGDGVWESMPEEDRCVLEFLCGNHTRGLPVDAFNRRFEEWMNDELGSEFAEAAGESGGRARLEKSGTALIRSIFKLIHSGWGAYEKVSYMDTMLMPQCSPAICATALGDVEPKSPAKFENSTAASPQFFLADTTGHFFVFAPLFREGGRRRISGPPPKVKQRLSRAGERVRGSIKSERGDWSAFEYQNRRRSPRLASP